MARVGAVAFGGATGALAAGGAKAIDTLGDISKVSQLADALGTPVEKLSGVFGLMEKAGQPLKESIEFMAQFGTALDKALTGKGEQAQELFQAIGRAPQEFQKLDAAERVFALFEGLQSVQDPVKKAAALSAAGGTDSMKYLLTLLPKTADELRELSRRYEISAADAKTAEKATEAYSGAVAAVTRVWRQMAVAAVPALKLVAETVTAVAQPVGDWVKGNKELVLVAVAGVAGVAALGAALVVTGTAVSLSATAVGGLVAVVSAVLSPLG